MNADGWKRAKEIFSAAVALTEQERESYLSSQTDGKDILDEARALLATYFEAPLFLEGVTAELPPHAPEEEPVVSYVGRRIGPWRLVREIGRGGMGVVWEAARADGQYEQRAAIKLLRASLLSDRDVRRFRDERQILASLNHPAIARLLDGGMLEDGSPYLVMEYIDGLRLDAWCDREQLDVRKRLELFLEVCSAVEFAHSHLVVHRDLKPANILVTAHDGMPKLLDFGIAKLLHAGGTEPQVTLRILTPVSASPEQVRGEALSTANDVFSLGVLLYLLLSGHHPFAAPDENPLETLRAICEVEPRLPSTVAPDRRRELAGELDAIILQAMRKIPAERYPSVRTFADDIRAWLNGAPVSAIRQPWWRRAARTIRRYKALSTAIAAAALSLIAGLVSISISAHNARMAGQEALKQRDLAAGEAKAARAINDFLSKDLLSQASLFGQQNDSPDPDLKVRTVLDRAAKNIEGKFTDQPLVEASLRETIGSSYYDLELFAPAQAQLERVVALRRKHLGEDAPETLDSMQTLASIYSDQSRLTEAEPLFKQVLEAQRRTLGTENPGTLTTALNYAFLEYRLGRFPVAESMVRPVVDTRRRLLPADGEDDLQALDLLSALLLEQGKTGEAETITNEELALARTMHGEDHPDAVRALFTLARIDRAEIKFKQAETISTKMLTSMKRLYGPDAPDTLLYASDLAVTYRLEGRYEESVALLDRVVAASRRVNGATDTFTLAYMCNLVQALEGMGRFAQAEQSALSALTLYRKRYGDENRGTLVAERTLALVYAAEGKYGQAEPLLLHLLATTRRVQGERHLNTALAMTALGALYEDEGKRSLAETNLTQALALDRHVLYTGDLSTRACLTALARLRLSQKRFVEAEALLREAMQGHGYQNLQAWDTFDRQSLLGSSLLGQGRFAPAEPLLVAGYEGLAKLSPAISVEADLPEAGRQLVNLYTAWGKPEQAQAWRLKVETIR